MPQKATRTTKLFTKCLWTKFGAMFGTRFETHCGK